MVYRLCGGGGGGDDWVEGVMVCGGGGSDVALLSFAYDGF